MESGKLELVLHSGKAVKHVESGMLEIVLHSGKGLKDIKHLGTMDPYVQVWVVAGDGKETERCKTEVAKNSGSNPVWDCPMEFKVASMENDYTLFCQILHDGKLLKRKIGEVQVRSEYLLGGDGIGKKLSYPVKTSSGEVMGELILSHKFSELSVKSGVPKKKPQPKKKSRMIKRIATSVGTKVASEAILFAGSVGLLYALSESSSGQPAAPEEDEDVVEEEDEDEDDDDDYEL